MATGTVSSISGDNWQLVATNTPTSGTTNTTTFSSLSGFKKYMVMLKTGQTSAGSFYFTINGGSGGGVIGGGYINKGSQGQANSSGTLVLSDGNTGTMHGGVIIDNTDKPGPKNVIINGTGGIGGGWLDVNSSVTSITISADTNFTTTPTFILYGIAA
jgi:hypothetical protein